MTIVSHEREPSEVGYVARYVKTVKDLEATVRADPGAFRNDQREAVAWAHVQAEMLRLHVRRRLSERLDGTRARSRWLHRQDPDDVGRADGGGRGARRGGLARGGLRRRRGR
jgi:hypothetical protein